LRNAIAILGILLILCTPGCASWVAMNQPGPTEDEFVQVGMHRAEVEQILRTGGNSYAEPDEHTRVRYQYSDGAHQGSKARILVYLAADLFTLFLSEIIFWPIELAVQQDSERTAEAEYGESNRLDHFVVMKRRSRKQVINIGEGEYSLLPGSVSVEEQEAEREETTANCSAMKKRRREC
jgi:hypothetical protein